MDEGDQGCKNHGELRITIFTDLEVVLVRLFVAGLRGAYFRLQPIYWTLSPSVFINCPHFL